MFKRRNRNDRNYERLNRDLLVGAIADSWRSIGDGKSASSVINEFACWLGTDADLFRVSSVFTLARLDRIIRDVVPYLGSREVDDLIDAESTRKAILCGLAARLSALGVDPDDRRDFERLIHLFMSNRITDPGEWIDSINGKNVSVLYLVLGFGYTNDDPIWHDVDRLWSVPVVRAEVEAAAALHA